MLKICIVVGLIAIVSGAALNLLPVAAMGAVTIVGGFLVRSIQITKSAHAESLDDEIHPDDRVRVQPLRKLVQGIVQAVEANKGSVVFRVVGQEAAVESSHLLTQAVKIVAARRKISRSSISQTPESLAQIAQLDAELEQIRVTLGEMLSKLAKASNEEQTEGLSESLRDKLSEMKALSTSFD